ncbi:MAG: hypothetical protein AB1489_13485 [Acidobacteriota bacterium]
MVDRNHSYIIELVRDSAYPLTGVSTDYEPLMALIGDATFVLLGEASHGTHAPPIGVIYHPETARHSHYFHARLADQFKANHLQQETHFR